MEDKNKNLEKDEIVIKKEEKNIINENDLNEDNNQDGNIKFDKNLANQEWINEKNYLRMGIIGACSAFPFRPFVYDTVMLGHFTHYNRLYFLNQDKFMRALPFGNRFFSIDTSFANNVNFMQMFSQKYFIEPSQPRYSLLGPMHESIRYNVYVYAGLEEKLINNKEVKRFIAERDNCDNTDRVKDQDQGLNSGNVSLDDRKKFDDIVNGFFNLPDSFMQCVVELFLKHRDYIDTFYLQGPMNFHLNCNCRSHNVNKWDLDHRRNGDLRDLPEKANLRRWETLSYYSRHMILCFFRPEYLYKNERPDPELVEFYVALNSLLSIVEKENAKAILNADDKKLNKQQQEMKKKLSGEDEKFRNNIINAWKDGFFLDRSEIEKSNNLFEAKEKKFDDDFCKIDKDDLKSKCFVYDENKGFVKVIDWLISEIENGNLDLIQQGNNLKNDLSSKNDYNEKIGFLIDQLFNGARIADKNNITYLKFSDEERNKYSQSDLPEKLKLVDNKIQFCPRAAKILKPSDYNLNVYDYGHLKKERLAELLYFESDEQKRDYIYLRENKDYYRDYVLHQDYGENEFYNKLYQCTQKADFGKYKREYFIFDETGKIIGMDVLAYFADGIVGDKLKLKDKEGKDISDDVKKIDNDLAREVFLMDKLKNDEHFVCYCDNENNKIGLDINDMASGCSTIKDLESKIESLRMMEDDKYKVEKDGKENKKYVANGIAIDELFNSEFSNDEKYKTIKNFIEMFRLKKEDIREIAKATHKKTHALIHRYALNKIFTEKINPVNKQNEKLIGSYVFDFSQAGCERDDLVFSKDGRVEYIKSGSLPRVLKLDNTKELELQARNDFIKDRKYDASNDEELQRAKNDYEDYKVSEEDSKVAENELKNLRANLDSNVCANLSDFYDFDSYRDEFLNAYIKFYQDAKIDYEYWCSECAKKFLKDIKEKKEKNNDELANIELKFFKGQAIKQEDLSQYTKKNKQGEIEEIEEDIELKCFEYGKIKFNDLSLRTQNNRQKEIIKIEVELLKRKNLENLSYAVSSPTRQNFKLQKQKSKLTQIKHRLELKEINNQTKLEKIDIYGETIFYSSNDFDNQQLTKEINTLVEKNVGLYKSKNIPYKLWDSDTKEYHHNELQRKWFRIGCIPLVIFISSIISFFLPFIEGYLVIKIVFTGGSFICGCLVFWKKIKNDQDRDYDKPDTYDNPDYCYTENNFNEVPGVVKIQVINKNQNVFSPKSTASISTSEITTNSSSSSTESEREDIPKSGFNNANQNQIKVGPSDH